MVKSYRSFFSPFEGGQGDVSSFLLSPSEGGQGNVSSFLLSPSEGGQGDVSSFLLSPFEGGQGDVSRLISLITICIALNTSFRCFITSSSLNLMTFIPDFSNLVCLAKSFI